MTTNNLVLMGTFMTFVTPLLSNSAQIEKIEDRLQELKDDGTIREYVKVSGLTSTVISRDGSKQVPFNSVWFTGMYKDSWPAPPTIDVMDEVINKLAWCADEGSHGGWVDDTNDHR
jgi:hypothetical protein